MAKRPVRRRARIAWSPQWGIDYIKWTSAFIRDNKWRVDRTLDHDDLMQEAWLTFRKVADTYPRVMDPGHFFSLYKRAIINKMHDRSCAKTRHGKYEVIPPEDATDFFIGRIGEAGNAGYVAALLAELPEELKLVVKHLTSADKIKFKRKKGEPRENLSRRICQALGLPRNMDPVADLKRLLST